MAFFYEPDESGDWQADLIADITDVLAKSDWEPEERPELVVTAMVRGGRHTWFSVVCPDCDAEYELVGQKNRRSETVSIKCNCGAALKAEHGTGEILQCWSGHWNESGGGS